MYAYLYDPVLRQRSFRSFLDRIESRLVDLGLGGKIYRLGPLLHLNEIISEELRRGAKTVVAVGTDRLFHQLLNAPNVHHFVLGFIPLNDRSTIGGLLGMPTDLGAATVLSHRIVRPVSLASANAVKFFWEISIPFASNPRSFSIRCDDQYTITTQRAAGSITIRNAPQDPARFLTEVNLRRGWFGTPTRSVFQNKKLLLEGLQGDIFADGQALKVERLLVQKLPVSIKVIVGRHRHEALAEVEEVVGATRALAMA